MKQYKAWELLPEEKVYLKSEVDAEIEKLNAIRKVHVEAIESMGAGLQQDEEVILHQKYKRCLAMARIAQDDWHLHNSFYAMGHQEFEKRKCEFYDKWHRRWLELAEKLKEAK